MPNRKSHGHSDASAASAPAEPAAHAVKSGHWFEVLLLIIRERRLDRIAAGYAVGGWLLVQVAAIALPAFDAPPWALRLLIAAALIGFPLTIAGAWILNRKSAERRVGKRFGHREAILLGIIGVVGVLTLVELAAHWSKAGPVTAPETVSSAAPPRSVAVLPFDNMSGDPKNRYFSEGISDEIIGLLSRNPALRVAARTSSFYFEDKHEDIRNIAQKLNVRTILEGSLRADGNRVRIEAALVNAADGYQIWSQSYDRSLSDILAIQSDIAGAIAQALAPELTGTHPAKPKPPQIDPGAYRDYLQAQFFFDQRLLEDQTPQSRAALQAAVGLFRSVVARAPDFADGQSGLAHALLYSEGANEFDAEIQRALQHALAVDPENPEALTVAISAARAKWDWDGLIRNAAVLKRTNAHTAIGAQGIATALSNMNLLDAAGEEYRQWARLDPFSYNAWESITRNYFAQARYADVLPVSAQALAIHPGDPVTLEYKCVSLASLKRVDEAKTILRALLAPGTPRPLRSHCEFFVLLNSEGPAAASRYIHENLAHGGPDSLGGPGDVGFMLSHVPGAYDEAAGWYEKAFSPEDWGYNFYPGQSPPPAFFQTPRWIAITQRPEYKAWQAARERARQVLVDNAR